MGRRVSPPNVTITEPSLRPTCPTLTHMSNLRGAGTRPGSSKPTNVVPEYMGLLFQEPSNPHCEDPILPFHSHK